MAQILLHGNLHVTIFEAQALSTGRASAAAPKFLRKVRLLHSIFSLFYCSLSVPDRSSLTPPNLVYWFASTVNPS
jgi:hypothetical protein